MAQFKGTPGPWAVHEIGPHWNNKSLTHLEITFGEDGECICDTVYQRADANLIAAAPELLEALCELVKCVVELEQHYDFDSDTLVEDALAVINKVLGETK